MAGTDSTKPLRLGPGPVVVLVEPQLGENIGMAARAMLNCGLTELRLVRPRDGWPSETALAAAAGADVVIEGARVFAATAEAIADLTSVLATTARDRDMTKDVLTPRAAAAEMRARSGDGGRTGVLFGREAKGLRNDDVALADALVMAPLNPAFGSLNLAQAVFMVGYEWLMAGGPGAESGPESAPGGELRHPPDTRPATKAELEGLFGHLEGALDDSGFLRVAEKRPIMIRNLRNLLQRARLTEQEVRTLRGVISSLAGPPGAARGKAGRKAGRRR